MVHYKVSQVSFCVDIADVPFDAASNMSLPAVTKNAVSKLELILSSNEVYQKAEVQKAIEDPSFMNALDGRVHGCLDSSAFVKGYTDTISPMLRSQVEIGSYITHINDHFVVGNTFASVLQLLREEKRPLRIRFEQGRAVDDPYAYHGELPVTAVSEVSEVERLSESLYDEEIHYLPNNVMIDSNHHAMVVMRLLLTMRSVSTIDNVRFLLRRRSVVPVYVNGEWIVEKKRKRKMMDRTMRRCCIAQRASRSSPPTWRRRRGTAARAS